VGPVRLGQLKHWKYDAFAEFKARHVQMRMVVWSKCVYSKWPTIILAECILCTICNLFVWCSICLFNIFSNIIQNWN